MEYYLSNEQQVPLRYDLSPTTASDKKLGRRKRLTRPGETNYHTLVGILVSGDSRKPIPKGRPARIYKETILQGATRGVFIYYFFCNGVDWKNKKITGFTYSLTGGWKTGKYDWPHIVYNRIVYRNTEKDYQVASLLKRFEDSKDLHLFNRRFLNKKEVFEAVKSNRTLLQHIPKTDIYSHESLKKFLQLYKQVFIKPIHGSKGEGILRIIRTDSNHFHISRAEWGKRMPLRCKTVAEVINHLNRWALDKHQDNYIIQQGIDLATFQSRIFDVRSQVQKNGEGKWVVTGSAVRLANPQKFVTHIPNGGTAANIKKVLPQVFSEAVLKKINEQFDKIFELMPIQLEQELGISLAVLSMDIGIDKQGHVWVLEVNSKPASFDENEIRKHHLSLLIDYFIYAKDGKI